MYKIMLSAGEASGDLHGAYLAKALRNIHPDARIFGMGGKNMRAEGVEIVKDIADIAGMGLVEIIKSLPKMSRLRNFLGRIMEEERPDVLVIIDYPGFNLRLAKLAHEKKIPVVSYISPKVWVHGSGRARKLAQIAEHVAVILPFEVEIYEKVGGNVTFIGNPLLDIVRPSMSREEALRYFQADPALPSVLLMPGSRQGEIEKLLPVMLAAAEKMAASVPGCQFFLPVAPTISREMVDNMIRKYQVKVQLTGDHTYDLMQIATVAIAASGTATLETSIMNLPTVIIYKLNALTYHIAKRIVNVSYIGLANIIAGRLVIPELIQDKATPVNIALEAGGMLTDEVVRCRILKDLEEVRQLLGSPGAADRGAQIIFDIAAKGKTK
jgi:lipid-A-disaccharide synthase